jgi:glutamyl-tRNA reductase
VCVYDIDTMNEEIGLTLAHRRTAIPLVEAIIDERIGEFELWYRSRGSIPVIASLARKAESIRNTQLEKLLGRCPNMSDRERVLVAGMSLTIVSKLLHSAIAKIREEAGTGIDVQAKARVIEELFELRYDALGPGPDACGVEEVDAAGSV